MKKGKGIGEEETVGSKDGKRMKEARGKRAVEKLKIPRYGLSEGQLRSKRLYSESNYMQASLFIPQ